MYDVEIDTERECVCVCVCMSKVLEGRPRVKPEA